MLTVAFVLEFPKTVKVTTLSLITQCDVAPHPRRRETSTAPLQEPKNSYNTCKTCIFFAPRNPAVSLCCPPETV